MNARNSSFMPGRLNRLEALPADGRFGSGPSKVRPEQIAAISNPESPMGTSHRRPPVRELVERIQYGMLDLFNAPEGYEILLGNGGASAVWDMIPFTLVEKRAQCMVIGEFSAKAARAVERASWLEKPNILQAEFGQMVQCSLAHGIDTYIYVQNETSTGTLSEIRRMSGGLNVVDGTSGAGGVLFDPSELDFYYFSPQKCFGADGGLWFALASPAAIERIQRLAAERWVPDFLNLDLALKNSRKNQTLNTPSIANLLMIEAQLNWMLEAGGLPAMAERSRNASQLVYDWAESKSYATPFVAPEFRSPVVATIDFDESVDAAALAASLREIGIVDIEPYRSLGRNQLRIATFPAVEIDDVKLLLQAIETAIEG